MKEYFKGLIWNLSTYQNGVCSDYGYNYGRRMSPTAEDFVSYLIEMEKSGKGIGRTGLLGEDITLPLSSGLTCLAALPSQVDDLIPHPFKILSKNGSIEKIYTKSMNPENNVFDMKLFQELCLKELREGKKVKLKHVLDDKSSEQRTKGRKIRYGDSFWTVLSRTRSPLLHPFDPPQPFSNRLSYLRNDPRIRASHIVAMDKPRWYQNESVTPKLKYSDMECLLTTSTGNACSLEEVAYSKVFEFVNFHDSVAIHAREKNCNWKLDISTNPQNLSALQCLHQLRDARYFDVVWEFDSHSKNGSNHSRLRVSGESPFDFILEEIRDTQESKASVKHRIAALAMKKILPHRSWRVMTVGEMKDYLAN